MSLKRRAYISKSFALSREHWTQGQMEAARRGGWTPGGDALGDTAAEFRSSSPDDEETGARLKGHVPHLDHRTWRTDQHRSGKQVGTPAHQSPS